MEVAKTHVNGSELISEQPKSVIQMMKSLSNVERTPYGLWWAYLLPEIDMYGYQQKSYTDSPSLTRRLALYESTIPKCERKS